MDYAVVEARTLIYGEDLALYAKQIIFRKVNDR